MIRVTLVLSKRENMITSRGNESSPMESSRLALKTGILGTREDNAVLDTRVKLPSLVAGGDFGGFRALALAGDWGVL